MQDLAAYLESLPVNNMTMSVEQRRYVKDVVTAHAPCNFLVWGVGLDSELWRLSNAGGRTVFLEDDSEWISKVADESPELVVHRVEYRTRRWQWRLLMNRADKLAMELPTDVTQTTWDVIFIDAPQGWKRATPGRMQSIFASFVLAGAGGPTEVLIHDMDRTVERRYSEHFFGAENIVENVDNLAHFHLPEVGDRDHSRSAHESRGGTLLAPARGAVRMVLNSLHRTKRQGR